MQSCHHKARHYKFSEQRALLFSSRKALKHCSHYILIRRIGIARRRVHEPLLRFPVLGCFCDPSYNWQRLSVECRYNLHLPRGQQPIQTSEAMCPSCNFWKERLLLCLVQRWRRACMSRGCWQRMCRGKDCNLLASKRNLVARPKQTWNHQGASTTGAL